MAVPASLITIPLSHYCEKARWALDRVGFPYREEPHAPLFHRLATKRKDGGTVPVMVAATSRFVDSTEILVHADAVSGGGLLYPRDEVLRREVDLLEEQFDSKHPAHTPALSQEAIKKQGRKWRCALLSESRRSSMHAPWCRCM